MFFKKISEITEKIRNLFYFFHCKEKKVLEKWQKSPESLVDGNCFSRSLTHVLSKNWRPRRPIFGGGETRRASRAIIKLSPPPSDPLKLLKSVPVKSKKKLACAESWNFLKLCTPVSSWILISIEYIVYIVNFEQGVPYHTLDRFFNLRFSGRYNINIFACRKY